MRRCKAWFSTLVLWFQLLPFLSISQDRNPYWNNVQHRNSATRLLRDLLAFPNDAQYPDAIARNIDWIVRSLQTRRFSTRLLESPAQPFVFAELPAGPGAPVILFYMHFDGQPVTPSEWRQPDPYEAVLKEKKDSGWAIIPWEKLQAGYDPDWRIFARSSSDDKGPLAMFLAALDRLGEAGIKPAYHIKLLLDSEEEKGSPNLPAMVENYQDLLQADQLLILDGPRHVSNAPTLLFGCRGVAEVDLEVFGPRADLHSGHYGNYAPNPAFELAALLASMKDSLGRILVPGFYDGIHPDAATRRLLRAVPDDKKVINRLIGIARETDPSQSYQEGLQYPSLNILNLYSGRPEAGTRNIVPRNAEAVLDIRLVPESDPARLSGLLEDFIRSKGFHVLPGRAPTEAERLQYPRLVSYRFRLSSLAFVTEPGTAPARWLSSVLQRVFRRDPVQIRMSGGTVPISHFIQALRLPAVIIPTVNPDNNQHGPDENLRLGNYFEGIDLLTELLQTKPLR